MAIGLPLTEPPEIPWQPQKSAWGRGVVDGPVSDRTLDNVPGRDRRTLPDRPVGDRTIGDGALGHDALDRARDDPLVVAEADVGILVPVVDNEVTPDRCPEPSTWSAPPDERR